MTLRLLYSKRSQGAVKLCRNVDIGDDNVQVGDGKDVALQGEIGHCSVRKGGFVAQLRGDRRQIVVPVGFGVVSAVHHGSTEREVHQVRPLEPRPR